MIEFILEIIFFAIVELIVGVFGLTTRFFVLKMFDSQLDFEKFSQIQSGRHKFFNAVVGILISIGLIFGIVLLILKLS